MRFHNEMPKTFHKRFIWFLLFKLMSSKKDADKKLSQLYSSFTVIAIRVCAKLFTAL